MRKLGFIAALIVGVFALAASTALAASPHFKRNSSITCVFSTTNTAADTVACTGTGGLSGLGGGDVAFDLTGEGFATYFCVNPSGSNEPAGQNKTPVSLDSEPTVVSGGSIKNGNLAFFGPTGNTLTRTVTAPTQSNSAVGCKTSKGWTNRVATVNYTSVTLTISQPVGTPIFICTSATEPDGYQEGDSVTLSCSAA